MWPVALLRRGRFYINWNSGGYCQTLFLSNG
jgi:hypothetical protein